MAGTEDLVVEYGAWELRWLMVLDERAGGVVDLIPGSLPGDDDVYSSYSLPRSFPSLLSPPSTREKIESEARASFHARQLELLPFSLHHESLDSALVTKSRVEVMVRIEGEQNYSPCPLARVSFERRRDDELSFLEATVSRLPRDELPVTCAAFKPPASFTDLRDYVEGCRRAYSEPWTRRKLLAEEIQKSFAVLDVDLVDYASLQLAVQVQSQDAKKRIVLVELAFAHSDFPAQPPFLIIRDYREKTKRELDRSEYLYSPRWDANRAANELLDHACRQAALVFGRPPGATNAAPS